jgi:hypothetical protein
MSKNRSEHVWPHFIPNRHFDAEGVTFFLDYLPMVEMNASKSESRRKSGDSSKSKESRGSRDLPPRDNFVEMAMAEKVSYFQKYI